MNKSELTAQVAKDTAMTQDQAGKAIDAMVAAIQGALAAGNQVTLVGFGSFFVAERAARTGRNPRTGAEIQIAASLIPQFKPGLTLKSAVVGKPAEAPKVAPVAKVVTPKAAPATKKKK